MSALAEAQVETITQLEEKFLRLLEVDRTSKEFEALFEEVDAALDHYSGAQSGASLRAGR